MKRRQYILLTGVSAAGTLGIATSASGSSMHRAATATVADDDSAFLQTDQIYRETLKPENQKAFLEIRNESPESLDVTFEDDGNGVNYTLRPEENTAEIEPGKSETVSVEVYERSESNLRLMIEFDAKGDTVSIEKQEDYHIKIADPEPEDDEDGS